MDFVAYAQRAARLVNARVDNAEDLRSALAERPRLAARVTNRDPGPVREIQREIRHVFTASARGEHPEVVRLLNDLLRRYPVSPMISGHDAQTWHLHVAEVESSITETLAAEALMGLAVVVCDLGADRFGVCQATRCANTFVDTSPNRSRRYCSARCSARANVAAFRARRRAEGGDPTDGPVGDPAGGVESATGGG